LGSLIDCLARQPTKRKKRGEESTSVSQGEEKEGKRKKNGFKKPESFSFLVVRWRGKREEKSISMQFGGKKKRRKESQDEGLLLHFLVPEINACDLAVQRTQVGRTITGRKKSEREGKKEEKKSISEIVTVVQSKGFCWSKKGGGEGPGAGLRGGFKEKKRKKKEDAFTYPEGKGH